LLCGLQLALNTAGSTFRMAPRPVTRAR